MKNLYLAILLLAFATNLSAFDKVWELQFSSAPHHVHYTEGHKELIVGEGNTFKKYNAETGALLDSVVMTFDSVLTKSINSYFITDDLKQIYALIPKKDTMYIKVIDLKTNTIDSTVFQIEQNYGNPNNTSLGLYTFEFPGQLVQISNRKFVYYANASLGKALPLYWGQSGIARFNLDSKNFSVYSRLSKLNYNNYKPSLYSAGSYSEAWKTGPDKQTGNTTPFQFLIKMEDTLNFKDYYNFNFENYISCISKNNKYIYSQANDKYSINRTDFKNIERNNFWTKVKWLLPYRNDDEILICIDSKIFHYNFKVNQTLDEISISTENQFGSDLNNDYLLSIGSKKVTAFKSGFKASTVASKLKDTLLTKSTGDTISLNAISNFIPIKEEWDLGDGRTVTGDTVKFFYPKSGEYIVIYTATYKDTVVKHLCKIKVLNKLKLNLDYKVEIKDGYNELTLFTKVEGESPKIKTVLVGPNAKSKYTTIDSSDKNVIYNLFDSGIFRINSTISNSSETITKELLLVLPIKKTINISYEYENLNNIYNFVVFNNNLYLLNTDLKLLATRTLRNNPPVYEADYNLHTELLYINNYKVENKYFLNDQTYTMSTYIQPEQRLTAYSHPRLLSNTLNIYIEHEKSTINLFDRSGFKSYKIPTNGFGNCRSFFIDSNKIFLLNYTGNYYKSSYFTYSVDLITQKVTEPKSDGLNNYYFDNISQAKSYYDNMIISKSNKDLYLLSTVENKLKVFSCDDNFRIQDTLMTEKCNRVFAKSINGNHAFAIIDTSAKDTNQYLKVMDIKNKKSKLVKLDSTVKYHQVYQVNDSITCLMGRKDKDLVIETFKNSLMYFSVFKIEHTGMFTILEKTDDNELHLSFVDTSIPASNLIKTKGFASIFDSVSKSKDTTSHPDDSTSNPIDTTKKDTTKNKGIIYIKDNQFGSVIQDPEFKAAKIYFKDSLDLSNSFVKIYTEAGTEILTYSLNKDQKELPIQTDKLYIGTYYVRIFNKSEEHNIGKFIIVK